VDSFIHLLAAEVEFLQALCFTAYHVAQGRLDGIHRMAPLFFYISWQYSAKDTVQKQKIPTLAGILFGDT
jgi:hypothetical protein